MEVVRPIQPAVHVLATTYDVTEAAMRAAVPFARGLHARLVVLVPQLVPYAIALDRPVDQSDVTVRRYRSLLEELGSDARLELCLCRRYEDVARRLPPNATVVVGGRAGGLWPSPESRLAGRLTRQGHSVLFVAMPAHDRVERPRPASAVGFLCAVLLTASVARAQEPTLPATPMASDWQYGGFVDVSALFDADAPATHLFRNRGTTPRVDELDVNMAAAYVRKVPTGVSRAGLEFTVHSGQDSETFGFSASAPNIGGADVLRHFGPTDVSYLAPVGKGLTIQGGIFSSLIGYDSLYAKDNLNYTRPWGADYTPYLMMGVNAAYPVTERLTATGLLLNGYFHLAHANDAPSVGGQLAYKASDRITVKQTVLCGSHQPETDLARWRVLSDTWIERKTKSVTAAAEYQFGSEEVAAAGNARAQWMAAQAPVQWRAGGPWALTVRPEFAWDRDGRWIGAAQSVTALTATVEYRASIRGAAATLRAEYRVDDSRGSGGGFYAGADDHLTPTQNLFAVALIVSVDRTAHR